ncbi:hypothetical protein BASA81_000801 [Batrachochytrium salamandrivorans]|nr:hypothetical protein BASA81_000801 [Batrachochytrium salamandrivorans]
MLANAISRLSRGLAPVKQLEGLGHIERESIHLAMLEGDIAVVLQASGESAAKTMRELLDQGVKTLVVVASSEEHKKELLGRLPKEMITTGRAVGVVDQYKPKDNVEALLARVRKVAGVKESAAVISVFEYQSTAETYSSLGNAVDFEDKPMPKL